MMLSKLHAIDASLRAPDKAGDTRREVVLAAALSLFLCYSSCGLAQQATAQANSAPQGTNDQQGDKGQLQEITITASKKSETLTQAPLAVTALTQEQLQNAGVVSVANLSAEVPNLQMRSVGFANAILPSIRGISNSD